MTRAQIIAEILKHRAELEAMGVKHLSLFGSAARDEMGPDSDIDIFVELSRAMGWDYLEIGWRLEEWLGKKVDFHLKDSLHHYLKPIILHESHPVL